MKKKTFRTALNNAIDASIDQWNRGIHDSKHAYVPKADILNT